MGEGARIKVGEGCDETFAYEQDIGQRGTIFGRAPHTTGNKPGDELWLVRLDNGKQVELWTEEMVIV